MNQWNKLRFLRAAIILVFWMRSQLVLTSLAVTYGCAPYISVFSVKNNQILVADGWDNAHTTFTSSVADIKWYTLKIGSRVEPLLIVASCDQVKCWDAHEKQWTRNLVLVCSTLTCAFFFLQSFSPRNLHTQKEPSLKKRFRKIQYCFRGSPIWRNLCYFRNYRQCQSLWVAYWRSRGPEGIRGCHSDGLSCWSLLLDWLREWDVLQYRQRGWYTHILGEGEYFFFLVLLVFFSVFLPRNCARGLFFFVVCMGNWWDPGSITSLSFWVG